MKTKSAARKLTKGTATKKTAPKAGYASENSSRSKNGKANTNGLSEADLLTLKAWKHTYEKRDRFVK